MGICFLVFLLLARHIVSAQFPLINLCVNYKKACLVALTESRRPLALSPPGKPTEAPILDFRSLEIISTLFNGVSTVKQRRMDPCSHIQSRESTFRKTPRARFRRRMTVFFVSLLIRSYLAREGGGVRERERTWRGHGIVHVSKQK